MIVFNNPSIFILCKQKIGNPEMFSEHFIVFVVNASECVHVRASSAIANHYVYYNWSTQI